MVELEKRVSGFLLPIFVLTCGRVFSRKRVDLENTLFGLTENYEEKNRRTTQSQPSGEKFSGIRRVIFGFLYLIWAR